MNRQVYKGDNYFNETITEFFNMMVNSCINITGNKPLEKDIFKNIISVQYESINKTIFIETETFNYVMFEDNGTIRLCEFFKKARGDM